MKKSEKQTNVKSNKLLYEKRTQVFPGYSPVAMPFTTIGEDRTGFSIVFICTTECGSGTSWHEECFVVGSIWWDQAPDKIEFHVQ